LALVERKLVEAALRTSGGNVTEAARLLCVGRGKLRALIRRHGIEVARPGSTGAKPAEWLVGASDLNSLPDIE